MFDVKHLLFLAPLAGVAFADLELDRDDVPPPCRDICQPIVDLTRRCDVDLPGNNNDRDEDRLERQCVCTNDSFDVGRIAGLCASCFQQNFRTPDDDDDDDNDTEWDDDGEHLQKNLCATSGLSANFSKKDIQEIMRDCGFSSESYSSQLSTAAQTVNVVASAPTATDQLTTTIDPSNAQQTNSNGGSGNNNNNDDNSNNNNNNNDDSSQSTDAGSNNADQTSSSNNPDETDLAVPGAVPLAGLSAAAALGLFGAVAAGGAFLL
jgi:hypothetical protein